MRKCKRPGDRLNRKRGWRSVSEARRISSSTSIQFSPLQQCQTVVQSKERTVLAYMGRAAASLSWSGVLGTGAASLSGQEPISLEVVFLSSLIGESQPNSFLSLSLSSAHMELGAAPAFVCSGNEEKNISDLCTHLWAITRYTICFSDIPRVRRKKHTKTFASFILRLGKYYGYNSSIHGACNDTQD